MNAPRPPRPEDAAEVARLAGEWGYPLDARAIASRLAVLMDDPRQCLRVIDGNGCLAGWIVAERRMILESGECLEIVGLVVDGTVRRGGVGRALVGAVEAWAREQGIDTLVVRSNVQRQAAHPFYEGLGYARRKSQHVYAKHLG